MSLDGCGDFFRQPWGFLATAIRTESGQLMSRMPRASMASPSCLQSAQLLRPHRPWVVGKGTTSVVLVTEVARTAANRTPLRMKLTAGRPKPRLAKPLPVMVKLAGGEARSKPKRGGNSHGGALAEMKYCREGQKDKPTCITTAYISTRDGSSLDRSLAIRFYVSGLELCTTTRRTRQRCRRVFSVP